MKKVTLSNQPTLFHSGNQLGEGITTLVDEQGLHPMASLLWRRWRGDMVSSKLLFTIAEFWAKVKSFVDSKGKGFIYKFYRSFF
ncbi:MAG: hypothetical protein ACOYNY_37820 [Caldilineaceae bacterium]